MNFWLALFLLLSTGMHYQSIKETEALLRKFECGSLALEEWTHSAHLAVCCLYLMRKPRDATRLLREGIVSLNRANGVISTATSGYHETLTLFWIAKVQGLLDVCVGDELSVLNAVVGGLANKQLVLFHFSRERIMSSEARERWCEPDLRPLPEPSQGRRPWMQQIHAGLSRRCA